MNPFLEYLLQMLGQMPGMGQGGNMMNPGMGGISPPGMGFDMPIQRPNDGPQMRFPITDGPQMGFPVTDGPRMGGRPMVPPGLGFNPPNRPPIQHANRPGRTWFDQAPPPMDRGTGPGRRFDGPQWGEPTAADMQRKTDAIAKGGSPGTRYDPRKMEAPMANNPYGGPAANRSIKR
jgi:hypothetical protein